MPLRLHRFKILKLGLLVLITINLFGQSSKKLTTVVSFPEIPQKFCDLSKKVNETSGLMYYDNNVWTFNDSQGKPEIYRIDKQTGEIAQTVKLKNASNTDWEDITHDENYIYIGDFGNNLGNRNDLRIYKVNKSLINPESFRDGEVVKVPSEIIAFSYNDQISFTVNNRSNDFDCESMVSIGDSLIIFSKNWVDGKTRMYKMPKLPAMYQLNPVSSFEINGLVTGADYNEEKNALILIGYKNYQPFLYYFKDFDGQQLGNHQVYKIKLNKMQDAQTEGVCWLNEDLIIFSNEQTKVFPQTVFQLNLTDVVKHIE